MQGFLSRPTRTIPPASAFNVEVTPALEAVMDRALSWSPARRFESAIEFAEELEATVAPCASGDVGRFVEKLAAARLSAQRKILGAIDAPYGRMSSSPPKGRRTENECAPTFGRSDHEGAEERAARRALRRARFMGRLATLRSSVAKALGPARWVRQPRTSRRSLAPWVVPAGEAIIRHGSTVFTGLSLVCLLLVATGANPRSWRRRPALEPSIAVTSSIQAGGRLGLDLAQRTLDDECTTVTPPVAPVPVPVVAAVAVGPSVVMPPAAVMIPGSPTAASAALALAPAQAREPSAPRHDIAEERSRAKAAPRREGPSAADRMPCDPPFTIDEAGIRRIKLDCL